MAFRTGDGLEVNGILVVDAGGNIESVPSVAINQGKSAMDTTNLKLEVNGNASIRGANALFFGVATNSYNSWKTKIWNNNTSTMYVNAQEFNVNNAGYGSVTFLKANASGVDGAIFRDIDNTGYYLSPSSSSKMVYLGLATDPYTSGAYRLNMGGDIHMQNNSINYVTQLHFNDDVRFNDDGNDKYLNFKYGGTTYGGIKFYNGSNTLQGYLYSDNLNFGLLSSDGSWAVNATNAKTQIYHRLDTPIMYDMDDTNYYVNPADTTQSAKFRQHVSIGDGGNTTNSGTWGARLNLTDSVHSKIEVGQDANSVNSHWYAHTGQDSIKFGTSTAHDVEFQRGGTTRLELTSDSITFSGSINMNGHNIRRGNHHTGHLEGSYNNIGGNGSKSNPIYTIGSSYNPSDAALGSMYGIGFADTGSSPTFLPGSFSGGWGMYVASSGTARVYLGGGTGDGNFLGNLKADAFYDIDDTNYYVKPSISASKIVGLNIHGGANQNTNDATLYVEKTNNNDWAIRINGTGSATEYGLRVDLSGAHSYAAQFKNNTAEYSRIGTDFMQHNAGVRSPKVIAGTSSVALTSNGPLAVYDTGNPYISFHTGAARTAYIQELSGRFYFGEVPYTESVGSFRAPAFYDTDNAAYYLDPAATGTSLNVAGNIIVPGYAQIAGVELSGGDTRSLSGMANNQWVTVANLVGSRKADIIEVYDNESSRHNYLKMEVSASYGQGSIQIINGVRHGNHTIQYVRLLFNTADRTYGTCKLQVYLGNWNTSYSLKIKQLGFGRTGWGRATIPSTVEAGLPSGNTIMEDTTMACIESAKGSFGSTGRIGTVGGIDLFDGSPIKFHTTSGDGTTTERGFIDAQEGGHLRIATSGGENIQFQDGGVGGTTNLTLLGTGEMVKEATERFTIKSHSNGWEGGMRMYAQNGSTIFQIHPDNNGHMYVDQTWRFSNNTLGSGYGRLSHHTGHLVGGYNNVGSSGGKSSPIYTIGSSYNPTDTSISGMYGIGYTTYSSTLMNTALAGATDWGMYVAANGTGRVWLDGHNGNISSAGSVYASAFYDSGDVAYYVEPASASRLDKINVRIGAEAPGAANSSTTGLVMRHGGSSYNNNTWAHKFHSNDHGGGVPMYLSETIGTGAWSAMQRWGSYSGDSYKNVFFSTLKVVGSVDADAFYDRDNTSYYVNPTGESVLYGDLRFDNYGSGIVGKYSSTVLQTLFAMGAAYNVSDNGSAVSNAYGLFYTHPNAGTLGGANQLDSHGFVHLEGGSFKGGWGGGTIIATNNMKAKNFYDYDNSAYFLNPSAQGGNSLKTIGDWRQDSGTWSGEVAGKMQYHSNNWYIQSSTEIIFRNASGVNTMIQNMGSGEMTLTGGFVTPGTIHIGPSGHLGIGDISHPKIAYPGYGAAWSGSGTTTGQIVIDLPGSLDNYDMLYLEIDIYEYSAKNATKLIIGGHNWNSGGQSNTTTTQWHNVGCKVIGDMDKAVRFGWRDDSGTKRRCIAIGDTTSSWSYGTVHVSKCSGATSFYNDAIDYTGNWEVNQTTSTSFFTGLPNTNFNSTAEKTLKTHGRMAAYGYQGNGNVGGTGEASWHPSGIYSNGTNWLYGTINMNNNYIANNSYIEFGANAAEQHTLRRYSANNIELRTHTTGASGILARNRSDQFRFQLYGDGSSYGFLDGPWASWDLQKTINGAFSVDEGSGLKRVLNEANWDGYITLPTSLPANGGNADTLDGLDSKGVGSATGASQVLTSNTNSYFVHQNWIDVGASGIYSSSTNGAHFNPNTITSYGSWRSSGSRGGYDGIVFDGGGDAAIMFDSGGNGGMYRQSGGGWYNYFHVGNNCMGINDSTTSSSYGAYLTGAFYATGNITAYSDRRVKENIVQIDSALEKVNKLEGVYYNRTDDESKTKEIGFIAQDVNEVVPELVTYAEDVDQYGVKYQNATALLVEAVKELTQQVNDLKQEIEEIKNAK